MPFFSEINSVNIGAISGDEVEISIEKGTMLSYIRTKPHDKGTKSGDKGAKSSDKGAKSSDKGVLSCDKGALSLVKAQKLTDFELFDNLGKL